ncbi:hypothetical protein ACWDYH_24835 [Nocardia goodfellowii]
MTQAFDAQDYDEIIRLLLLNTKPSGNCRIWAGFIAANGYGSTTIRHSSKIVHRLMLHAKMRGALGDMTTHHICANRACIEPSHIEPVSQAANNAEMLLRGDYERRIVELEAEVARLSKAE